MYEYAETLASYDTRQRLTDILLYTISTTWITIVFQGLKAILQKESLLISL